MKIGITCYPTYGGSGIVASEIGMELAARGHQVHFITYANPIRLSDNQAGVFYHEVEVSDYPLFQYPPYSLALASRMAEVAENESLDLLHVHYAIPHSVSALLAAQIMEGRLPFITTLHGTDVTLVGADPSYLPITRLAIEKSPGVTCISEHLRDETQRVFGVRREIDVIPNFVNCELYSTEGDPAVRARYAQTGEKLLVHLSNFRPVKRVLDCIRTFAEIAPKIPSRLLMIGDGPDRAASEKLARELGVDHRTIFVGKQQRIASLLAVSDLLLLPSEMESFGLAALEAMACGSPPVATKVGGLPGVVTDGHDGRLVALGDTGAMADAALEILNDAEIYHRYSSAARETAVSRFNSEAVIPRYLAAYERVCRGGA